MTIYYASRQHKLKNVHKNHNRIHANTEMLKYKKHTGKNCQESTKLISIFITFASNNIEIVKYCQEYFGFCLPSALWAKRVSKFESSFERLILSVQ